MTTPSSLDQPFSWEALSGSWRGPIYECYGSPVWLIRCDLTFQANGDFAGPCVFQSYPRYNPGLPERTTIKGRGAHKADGTPVITGAALIRDLMLFMPVLSLSTRGHKRRLEGENALLEVAGDLEAGQLLAAALQQEPGRTLEECEMGQSYSWVDRGTWKLRQLSAADRARDRLRARVHQAMRAAIPEGAQRLRTRVATRVSPEGPGWVAEAEVDYTPRGVDEYSTLTVSAPGKSGKEALKNLLARL